MQDQITESYPRNTYCILKDIIPIWAPLVPRYIQRHILHCYP